MSQDNAKRLNKFISETGFCSRRAADKLIEEGRVTINGKQPEMGTKVLPGDDVVLMASLSLQKKSRFISPSTSQQASPVRLSVISPAISSISSVTKAYFPNWSTR